MTEHPESYPLDLFSSSLSNFSNLLPSPCDLTEASLEELCRELLKTPGPPLAIRPTTLISTYPLPPRRAQRFQLISAEDAVNLDIPCRSLYPATLSEDWEFYWVDKRCLRRFRRRSSEALTAPAHVWISYSSNGRASAKLRR
jgi:hypothetical protein